MSGIEPLAGIGHAVVGHAVLAHAVGHRPGAIPLEYALAAGGVALWASFDTLRLRWRRARLDPDTGRAVPPGLQAILDGATLRWTLQLVGLLLTAAVAVLAWNVPSSGPLNQPTDDDSPALAMVYVVFWVGLPVSSLLVGPVWRTLNSLRTIHLILARVFARDPQHGLFPPPLRCGYWPAVLGLFGFAWLELVQPDRTTLAVLRVWALAWLVILVLGAIVFGRRWIGSADPFEVYAGTVARLSPWQRAGGQLRLVNPLAHLTHWRAPPGAAAVVAALLGSTAFDSFANTSFWISTVQNSDVISVVWETLGLITMIVIVLLTFSLAAAWMGRYGDRPATAYPRLMVGSVVPIVIGYAIAHYATLLVVEGQRTAINWSDPLGRGWNVFGSAEMGVNSALFGYPTAIALIQLIAIVGGHVLGIIAAHELAVRHLPPARALVGQLPMLVVMIGYTSAGLVLLFSP